MEAATNDGSSDGLVVDETGAWGRLKGAGGHELLVFMPSFGGMEGGDTMYVPCESEVV